MVDRVGQQLGNYRLLRLLGKGGFAEVYLGEHIHLGTQAAIKVLHTQLASVRDIATFRNEAKTIAALVHPHIVRVLDFDVEEETPFLVMDYASNGSLRQRLPQGTPFPAPMLIPYIRQVAEALQYAHEAKLVHRDVKPENMLLGRDHEVLLSDFGIAMVAQTSSSDQGAQGIAGTTAYMAPEQLQGHPRPASDQYALAAVVYEWLTGAALFHGSYIEVASQHVLAAPPPLRQRVPTLMPTIEQVVMTALAKDPRERFASVIAFAHAFEHACQAAHPPQIFTPSGMLGKPMVIATPPDQATTPGIKATPPGYSDAPTLAGYPTGHFQSFRQPPVPPPRLKQYRWGVVVIIFLLLLLIGEASAFFFVGKGQTNLAKVSTTIAPSPTHPAVTPTLDARAALQTSDFSKFIEAFAAEMANKDYAGIQSATDTENFQAIPLYAEGISGWNEIYAELKTGNLSFIVQYPPITADQEGYACVGYSKTGIPQLGITINASDVQYVVGTAMEPNSPPSLQTVPDATVFGFELPNLPSATWLWRLVTFNNQAGCNA